MSDLSKLLQLCKCGVFININSHINSYTTAKSVIDNNLADEFDDTSDDIRLKMIELNTIVEIQFYPNTPVGSYVIYHYDVDKAITEALDILNCT